MSQAALEILEYNRQFNKIIEALALEGVIDIKLKEEIGNRYTTLLLLDVQDKEAFESELIWFVKKGIIRSLDYQELLDTLKYMRQSRDDYNDKKKPVEPYWHGFIEDDIGEDEIDGGFDDE